MIKISDEAKKTGVEISRVTKLSNEWLIKSNIALVKNQNQLILRFYYWSVIYICKDKTKDFTKIYQIILFRNVIAIILWRDSM